ncbi:MAG TPA: Slp family lipoprotein [Gammaproteobacteria bacterium]|nr:Slp family lipoprotein [Gammaproteobacteria bacterium]
MKIIALLMAALLAGCASHIPQSIREAPPGNPTPAEVRAAPERFTGSTVRWGGVVAEVHNRQDDTEVVVVARELSSDGRPYSTNRSDGRFLARIDGFLDPMVYDQGREFTVTGTVAGAERRTIGDYEYRYPVVEAEAYYLWEPWRLHRRYDYSPYDYYDPWYPGLYPWPHRPYYW